MACMLYTNLQIIIYYNYSLIITIINNFFFKFISWNYLRGDPIPTLLLVTEMRAQDTYLNLLKLPKGMLKFLSERYSLYSVIDKLQVEPH